MHLQSCPVTEEIHPPSKRRWPSPKHLMEHAGLLSSHLPHGRRDNCVSRGTCPQDMVDTVTTWLPNHYKRGNRVLQGTFCSLRGFLLLLLNCRAVFNLISSAPGSKGAVFLLLSSTGALLGFGCWGLLFVIPVINAKILTKKFHSIFISFQLGKQTRNYT